MTAGSSRTRTLLIAATVLGALVAGVSANRLIVVNDAWAQTGADSWVRYTRIADLGRGRVWYPAVGLSALACCVAAAISFRVDRRTAKHAATPIYGAALLAIAALVVTVHGVVPATLAVAAPDSTVPAADALLAASRWWTAKAVLHILTLGANVWATALVTAPRAEETR